MASKALETDATAMMPREGDKAKLQMANSDNLFQAGCFSKPQVPQITQQILIKDASNIHFGNQYIVSAAPTKPSPIPKQVVKTRKPTLDMKTMSKSTVPLDREAMDVIATHMDASWKDFARKLNYSEGQVHQFVEDHSIRGVKEVIYQFLLEWSQNEGPTLGKVVKILWENRNEEVLQKLIDEYWLPRQKEKSEESKLKPSDKSE